RPALSGGPARPRVEGRTHRRVGMAGARRAIGDLTRAGRRLNGGLDRGRVLDCAPVGAWRSLVAHQSGGLVVVGSNPAAPTKSTRKNRAPRAESVHRVGTGGGT